MSARTIRFYFDYESPNAYFAWTQLPALAQKHRCAIEPAPVLYAALLDAHGQRGPGEMPAKGRWMMRNCARKSVLLGVPLEPPPFFPFNPLLALRLSLLPLRPELRTLLIDALFKAVWARSLHVSEPAVAERVLDEAGLPGAELVKEAQTDAIKLQLRRDTEAAVAQGVFGVPTMIVDNELFWGYDDFPFLDAFLAGKDPLDPSQWARLSHPRNASSVRRQFRSGAG